MPVPPAINTAALYFSRRLTGALETIASSPLTLVEAPMGYGKTVAVREYLRNRKRVIWTSVLSAGPDSGEDTFWRDFCRAVAKAFPKNTDVVESLSRLGYPRDAVLADAARELVQQLGFASGTVLVIDDIHLLPETPPGGGMAGLCALLARQDNKKLRQVLISRDTWAAGKGGRETLALKGRLAVIDREAFALKTEDIQEYYALCGLRITLKDAATLRESTGGWISALYLYLLRYGKDGEPLRFASPEGGLARPVSVDALLEEEIFSLLPESARELLLILSPLDRFTREQAEFLFGGNGDVAAALSGLQRKNSFIAFDAADKTYALHSLFRHYLRERFEAFPLERRQAVYSRLADWFIQRKEAVPAIEACHAAGEYERALDILESDMSRNLVTEKSRFFVELFRACPEEVLDRHMGAAFKYAIAVFAAGDYAAFASQLAWIRGKCAARAAEKGEDDPEAMAWRGELEFLLSLAAYNDIAAMSGHHRKANGLLKRPTKLFGPDSPWTLGCPSVLFMFHKTPGKLDDELALMVDCLPHYYALASMHGAGGEHQMRAEALYNRGDFTGAALTCRFAQAMAWANGQVSVLLCCLFLRLRLALVEDRVDEAVAVVREMREAIRERRNFFLLHTVDLCESHIHAFTGELENVPDWLRFGSGGENRLYTFAGGYYYIAHGRILLRSGEYAAVAGLFAWLLQSKVFASHLMFTVYAYLYLSAAKAGLGRKTEAAESLGAALNLALPDGLYMPFVENAEFLPQLKTLSRKQPYRNGVRRILHLAFSYGKHRQGWPEDGTPAKQCGKQSGKHSALSLLTKRERELVCHALTGKTYPEIAAVLGLAPSTVKRAFGTIHKKLGVNSREQLTSRFGKK